MDLSDRVKLLREQKGLTQEELAKKMGYASRVSVNKIEMGRPVSQKIIVKLAEALDTSPAYLMGWLDEDKEKPVPEDQLDSEIIRLFTMLSDANKMKVLGYIQALIDSHTG